MGTDMITSISYSTDNGETWTTTNNTNNKSEHLVITVNVNEGDKVMWKGDAQQLGYYDEDDYGDYVGSFFSSDCKFDAQGNIMSLLYGDDFKGKATIENEYAFACLFYDYDEEKTCEIVDAKKLLLTAETLTGYCYYSMFSNCTSLTTAPELPATTLAQYCYYSMFFGCTNLTTAPELPATTVADECYSYMFSGCTSLNYIKCLATNALAVYCTEEWVYNVAATGTFIKADNINWPTGVHGIPEGWNVYIEDDLKVVKHYELDESELAISAALNDLNSRTSLTEITWAELKELRDNSNLVPGKQYRITDYECGTIQKDTFSANHQFDIIVTADSENTLNENARAALHEGDTYFANNNLAAWELKYCLDNDDKRFAWAKIERRNPDGKLIILASEVVDDLVNVYVYVRYPAEDSNNGYAWVFDNSSGYSIENYLLNVEARGSDLDLGDIIYTTTETGYIGEITSGTSYIIIETSTEGKGVIYWMKDEFNNECPYDFKNIQFRRKITFEDGYPLYDGENHQQYWVYTFSGNSHHVDSDTWSELKDGSLESPYRHQSDEFMSSFHNNIIKPYILFWDTENEDDIKCGKQYLNDIVLLGYWNEIGSAKNSVFVIANCCHDNTFYENCHSMSFNYGCNCNTFMQQCNDITFVEECCYNTFDVLCHQNIFESQCKYNKIGRSTDGIEFGYGASDNIIIGTCSGITTAAHCCGNIITESSNIELGESCYCNIIYNCGAITLFDGCKYNKFEDGRYIYVGNECLYNIFMGNNESIKFGTSSTYKGYIKNCIFDKGTANIYLTTSATTNSSAYLQNVHVHSGVRGTNANNRKNINLSVAGNDYEINVKTGNDIDITV